MNAATYRDQKYVWHIGEVMVTKPSTWATAHNTVIFRDLVITYDPTHFGHLPLLDCCPNPLQSRSCRGWADTHLPGRHDQSSHGRKGGKKPPVTPSSGEGGSTDTAKFRRLTPDAAVKMQQTMEDGDPITKQQAASIRKYTGEGYREMNTLLREGELPEDELLEFDNEKQLHTAIRNAREGLRPLPHPVRVTRFVNPVAFGISRKDLEGERGGTAFGRALTGRLETMKGSVLQERGFLSTTLGDYNIGGDIEMHIDVPAGVPAIYVNDHTRSPETTQDEQELLLSPGLKMKIIGVQPPKPGGLRPVVRMKVVSDAE